MQRFVYISLALCSGLAVFLYSSGIGQPNRGNRKRADKVPSANSLKPKFF